MLFSTAIFASACAGLVAAGQTFSVDVGAGGLKFTPNNLTAEVGDMITFIFRAKNHTVTQSSFKTPCTPLEGGFDSGYVGTPPNTTDNFTNYTIMVTDTKPKWVFCAQASPATGNHCHKGMVFSINPDAGNNTSADAYMKNAMALGANDPANVPAPAANATASASAEGASATGGSAPASEGTNASSAAGASPTDGSAPASNGSSSSGTFQFPSGTDSAAGASATDAVANAGAGATAASDLNPSAASSGTSSAAVPSKTSGAKSVARNSAAVLAAVGVVLGLVL